MSLGFLLHLRGRQQLCVTRSVHFTLFVVSCLTSDTLTLKTNPHLWLSLQHRPNETFDVILTTALLFFLPATSDYWQLQQSRFSQPGAGKTTLTFSWSGLNSSPGSAKNLQVDLRASFWSLSAWFLFLSLLCLCSILPRTEATCTAALARALDN